MTLATIEKLIVFLCIVIVLSLTAQAYHQSNRIEGNFEGFDTFGRKNRCVAIEGNEICGYYNEFRVDGVKVRDLAISVGPRYGQRSVIYSPAVIDGKFARRTIYVRSP